MTDTYVHPLPERTHICQRCRQPVWLLRTPDGNLIALDAERGPYLTAGPIAYRTDEEIGYRDHAEHCEPLARAPLAGVVADSEFLWG